MSLGGSVTFRLRGFHDATVSSSSSSFRLGLLQTDTLELPVVSVIITYRQVPDGKLSVPPGPGPW